MKLARRSRIRKILLHTHLPQAVKRGVAPLLLVLVAIGASARLAVADTVSFGGVITQSTQDGTGPAVNNSSLNNIQDGDSYSVVLNVNGSISAPGTYTSFTGATFSDPTAGASESSFGVISLTIATDATNPAEDDLSLLSCLTTGFGCAFGDQLDANFQIAAASLDALNGTAAAISLLTPLDLLEDDGNTDIQGAVTAYSYSATPVNPMPPPPVNPMPPLPASPVPEPSSWSLLAAGIALLAATSWHRKARNRCFDRMNG